MSRSSSTWTGECPELSGIIKGTSVGPPLAGRPIAAAFDDAGIQPRLNVRAAPTRLPRRTASARPSPPPAATFAPSAPLQEQLRTKQVWLQRHSPRTPHPPHHYVAPLKPSTTTPP